MSFGDNLRTLIEEREMTQKGVARELNIAPSTLGSYVQGVREPDFFTLKNIANYFDVSIDYLLDYHPNQNITSDENDLLRIFRSLSNKEKSVCIEQCKAFIRTNDK